MQNWIYRYPPLETGVLLKRYKRFFADIQLTSGEVITAHCPNTGPMTGVSTPGSLVKVSRSDSPKRKLPYTWEMIQVNDRTERVSSLPFQGESSRNSVKGQAPSFEGTANPKSKIQNPKSIDNEPTWVGVNTALPNRVIKLALEQRLFPELADSYNEICCEVPYGKELKSRVDFLLKSVPIPLNAATEEIALCDRIQAVTSEQLSVTRFHKGTESKEPTTCRDENFLLPPKVSSDQLLTAHCSLNTVKRPIYLEVKSVTLSQGNVALFPDTVTTRGQKHLRELMALLPQARAIMLYFINRGDCLSFAPADSYDPVYGQLLREAVLQGVEVLPCRFEITPEGIRYLGLAEFLPMQHPVMATADVPVATDYDELVES